MGLKIETGDHAAAIVEQFRAALPDPSGAFTILVRFQARSGAEAEIEAAFAGVRTDTLREPGAIAFDLNRDTVDPGHFVVYERWRSLDHFAAHLRMPYVGALRHTIESRITGAPEFHILRPAAE